MTKAPPPCEPSPGVYFWLYPVFEVWGDTVRYSTGHSWIRLDTYAYSSARYVWIQLDTVRDTAGCTVDLLQNG